MYPPTNGGTNVLGGHSIGNATGYATASPAPIGVHDTVGEQQTSIAELHKIISDLEVRLASVLRPSDINAAEKAMPPQSQQLLHRIQESNTGIRMASARLNSLLNRIEL